MKFYKVWSVFCYMLLVSALFIGCIGCSEDDEDVDDKGESESYDAATMLNDFANIVVLATYTDLDNKAGELLTAVKALAEDTTQANLEKAQQAWVATRHTLGTERSVPIRSC